MLLKTKCVFWFSLQLLSETFIILRRIGLRVSTLYSRPILMKLEFSVRFSKKPQISNFTKIRPVGDEFCHANRRTDMKLIVAFRNFAKAPKNRERHR